MLSQCLKKIACNMARRVKPITESTESSLTDSHTQSNSITSKQSPHSVPTHHNADPGITPQYLQYESSVKEKLREKVAKQLRFNPSYEGQDPNPTKLVNRPSKGVVWGLGGQLIAANRKVQLQGLRDDTEDIVEFLQLHQVKNIYVHDFHKDDPQRRQTNKRRYHILGSCYSSRHCWKVSSELKNAFNLYSGKTMFRRRGSRLKNGGYDPIFAVRTGGKDEEFAMIDYKEYSVVLMTEEQREAMDLEWKWNNEVKEETVEKFKAALGDKRRRRNQAKDL